MAAVNGQVAMSGLAGALTSLFVGVGNAWIEDGNLKSIYSVMAGVSASILTFEFIGWITIFRLWRQQVALSKLIPRLERIQEEISGAITKQVDLMKQHNASATAVKEAQKGVTDGALDLARTLSEIQRRAIQIARELGT